MKNLLTKEAFAEWCEKQPANKEYDYCDSRVCAAAQFLQSVGVENYDLKSYELPTSWRMPLLLGRPTFGALAARLRESQP